MVELNLGLEKSGKSQGISYCLESGYPVKREPLVHGGGGGETDDIFARGPLYGFYIDPFWNF